MVTAAEIVPYRIYEATARVRRGDGWDVGPLGEAIDGRKVIVSSGWQIDPEENPLYPGEWAMEILSPVGEDVPGWLASGDLADLKPLDGVTRSQIRKAAYEASPAE